MKIIKRFLSAILLLSFVIVFLACESLQNEHETDWVSVQFSVDAPGDSGRLRSTSGGAVETAMIMAVPDGVSTPDFTAYLDIFYDSQLQDLANNTVSLRVPLNTPIRLAKVVFKEEQSLDTILDLQPEANCIGMSDSFSINGASEKTTIGIETDYDSCANDISAFSFEAADNAALSTDVAGTIVENLILVTVPHGTDVSSLVATFTFDGDAITVNGTTQTSGTTSNDFTSTVVYRVTSQLGTTYDYTVHFQPAVASISPIDEAIVINPSTSISVTFYEAMDTSSISTNTSSTTCSGSIQLTESAEDFASCIQMSAAPTASNDNRTFTLTPAADLSTSTTYKLKVTNGAADSRGTTMTAAYATATGFTTDPGTGVWAFIDGDGADGLNKDSAQSAQISRMAVFNSKLYVAWEENPFPKQARVKEWDSTGWRFVDYDTTGINKNTGDTGQFPQLTVFNSKLYATWMEQQGGTYQVRIAEWDGVDSWNFADGDGTDGINHDITRNAQYPELTVFNARLYICWEETDGSRTQIRAAEWDGTSTWTPIDGGGATGMNYDTGQFAQRPSMMVFNSVLYIIWNEFNGSAYNIRVAKWNGGSSWSFVDGGGTDGINKVPTNLAQTARLNVFDDNLYAIWSETNGSKNQIRVARWDGSNTWDFIDGDAINGINYDTAQDASDPRLIEYNSKLVACWHESDGAVTQIRIKEWDGSSWSFIDGGGPAGINNVTTKDARSPQPVILGSKLAVTWYEEGTTVDQVRVAVVRRE